jgi:cbb3-type cytochrome oxidase subunit 3
VKVVVLNQLSPLLWFSCLLFFFFFFIALLYLSYSKNKKKVVKEEISLRLRQANLESDKSGKTFEQKFNEEYGDEQYKMPIVLATILIFSGFLLLFFPAGLSGFELQLTGDLSSYIKSIADAPPITYGFIGAYFFSVQLVFRRYVQSDLKPQVFMFVTMRILITLILTFVISLFFLEDSGGSVSGGVSIASGFLAFSFLIGIFPQVGLT